MIFEFSSTLYAYVNIDYLLHIIAVIPIISTLSDIYQVAILSVLKKCVIYLLAHFIIEQIRRQYPIGVSCYESFQKQLNTSWLLNWIFENQLGACESIV